jgi:hypothetical protein
MLEFKSPEDLAKLSPDDPVFPIVEDLVKCLITDYIAESYEYIGFLPSRHADQT